MTNVFMGSMRASFPECIQKDLEKYLTYLSGGDPFSAHPMPFKPTSLNAVKGHFWRYLSALHHQGVDLQKYARLSNLVSPEMFKLRYALVLGEKWL